jgi:acyl-CoA thioesterase I
MKISVKTIIVTLLALALLAFYWLGRDANRAALSNITPRPQVQEEGVRIIAFGDSLTAGYGLPQSESYPSLLETALKSRGKSVGVINAGVSGETTRGNLERADFIRRQNPDIVLLGIGGNDALRRLPLSETRDNIRQTVETLISGENPPVVILLRMQSPLNAGLAYKREFDAIYDDIARDFRLPIAPLLTAEVFLDASNKLPDGIHLNEKGNQFVVNEYILPITLEVLNRI